MEETTEYEKLKKALNHKITRYISNDNTYSFGKNVDFVDDVKNFDKLVKIITNKSYKITTINDYDLIICKIERFRDNNTETLATSMTEFNIRFAIVSCIEDFYSKFKKNYLEEN